jgi:hypothetical protein
MRRALRFVAFLVLLSGVMPAKAGIAEYTDRGKIDFDTAMELLNPYGTWVQVDGRWAYTPLNHATPYTNGRWLYTEYGWYWKGNEPHSWATEHYGFWKRSANHVWSWYPTPDWLPQIVEIRATTTHIGWRAAEVDTDGDFVEPADDRFAKTDEWTFVSLAQFTRPITPSVIASPDMASKILDDSAEAMHTYVTYRPISRPGPHPADFLVFKPNGMFAPQTETETAPDPDLVMPVAAKSTVPVVKTSSGSAMSSNSAPSGAAPSGAAPSGAAPSGAAVAKAPASDGSLGDADDAATAAADARQVSYWITMSLPSYWTPRPADAGPKEIYIYRPEFYQDQDGIERRVQLWLNPSSRSSLGNLRALFSAPPQAKTPPTANGPGQPAEKVLPSAPENNAFRSPFDERFRSDTGAASSTKSSKAAPATPVTAPTPAAPAGSATNAAPSP